MLGMLGKGLDFLLLIHYNPANPEAGVGRSQMAIFKQILDYLF